MNTPSSSKPLLVSQLAKLAHVNVETVRYYEREGLLPKPHRSESGYRHYTSDAVECLQFIKQAQELGFQLKEIKELLILREQPNTSADVIKTLALQKLATIDHKLAVLTQIRHSLQTLVDQCPGHAGSLNECPILMGMTPTPHTKEQTP